MNTISDTIIITPDATEPQRGTLCFGGRMLPCVLGRAGTATDKIEGDGATPVGVFPLRRVLYRADRLVLPQTALPNSAIAPDDGWCDDPADASYNQPIKLPYGARTESMWRDDGLYDLVVVIGHNDDPVVAQSGSAIFMHVAAEDGAPTAGCVALARDDLLWVLIALQSDTKIQIRESH